MKSVSGDLWKAFYREERLSWLDPSAVDLQYLERFSRSEWISRLLKLADFQALAGIKVLEAGCGTGIYALALAFRGVSAEAFDYNEEALSIAQGILQRVQKKDPDIRVNFFKNNLLKTDLPSERYDLVFNQAVLEYFCDESERRAAIGEMVRMARPGGKVAVIVQHTGHPFRKMWEAMKWPGYSHQPPVITWSPQSLRQELLGAGLKDIRISGFQPWKAFFFWPRWYQKSNILERAVYFAGKVFEKIPYPDGLRACLGIQLIGVGTKP